MAAAAAAAAEAIKEKHVSQGRGYPRPTDTCDECKETIQLCWGEVVAEPYWRHVPRPGGSESKPKCTGASETATHRLAKRVLLEYIATGSTVVVSRTCEKHLHAHRGLVFGTAPNRRFCEEYRDELRGCLWDIAAVDIATGQLHFAIEIVVKIPAWHSPAGADVTWVAIDATDVLDKLDRDGHPETLMLKDLRKLSPAECYRCQEEVAAKESEDAAADAAKPLLFQFASELGFLVGDKWKLPVYAADQKPDRKLWKRFLDMERCMKCGQKQERAHRFMGQMSDGLKIGRPFCRDCYMEVRADCPPKCQKCGAEFAFREGYVHGRASFCGPCFRSPDWRPVQPQKEEAKVAEEK
jgi:hypothetical protein